MTGFAFAAIKSENDDVIPEFDGPGTGDYVNDEKEKEKELAAYTITGTAITPFVAFSVTVTASNSAGKGNGGHLQSSFDYHVLDDGGRWESGTSRTWTLYTRTCDKNITSAQFSWIINGREPVTTTLPYNAGMMTPEIPSSIVMNDSFVFFVRFSGHGPNCRAKSLSDFGATYWWEVFRSGEWIKTTSVNVSSVSFSQGVLTGTAHVGVLLGCSKLRLCVSYAGNATAYDEANISAGSVTIEFGESTLHTWGGGVSLAISSDALAALTAGFYIDDSAYSGIVDADNEPVAFSFSGTSVRSVPSFCPSA